MMDLNDFLRETVEGRLFGDMRAMKAVTLPSGAAVGAVGYPLVMSAFAGIELIGALLSTRPFSKTAGAEYFREAWRSIYPMPPEADLADLIYKLGRNGLAHLYAPKGPITVHKGNPVEHLRLVGRAISIDANKLADDLIAAYNNRLKAALTAGSSAATRLNEMQAAYKQDTTQAFAGMPVLPSTPALPTMPGGAHDTSSPTSSGSVFVHR